jgi:hypothetical protein
MRILVKHIGTLALVSAVAAACGGGGGGSAPTPPCDMACKDGVAVRSLRDAIKVVYNILLQGQPTGTGLDKTLPKGCPLGGTASVSGDASSNADQGATNVNLTYVFTACTFSETDTDPTQTFQMKLDGTVTESGVIAVQPSSTTALTFHSDAMTFSGTVYYPAISYAEGPCAVQLGQDGNDISGTLCEGTPRERSAGTTL